MDVQQFYHQIIPPAPPSDKKDAAQQKDRPEKSAKEPAADNKQTVTSKKIEKTNFADLLFTPITADNKVQVNNDGTSAGNAIALSFLAQKSAIDLSEGKENSLHTADAAASWNIENAQNAKNGKLNIDLQNIPPEIAALITDNLDPASLSALQQGKNTQTTDFSLKPVDADKTQENALMAQGIIIPMAINQNLEGRNGRGLAKELAQMALEAVQNSPSTPEGNKLSGLEKAMDAVLARPNADHSTFPSPHSPGLSNLFSSAAWDSVFPEGIDWSQNTNNNNPALPHTGSTANLTSLISQAPQAGQAHPATQVIAATISKAATHGENKNFTLKLNPPELGRLEIQMEFGKDKTVKTNIIIEKPETHLMLQRDAHMLERALTDAGLDVDSGSLSFELAQDGSLFDQDNNNHRGSNASGGGSSDTENGEEGEILIETTMDWYVDAKTGMTHYSILA